MGKKKKKIKINAAKAKEAICNYIKNISKEPGEGVFASHPFLPSEFEKMYVGICTDFNSKDFDTLKVREHLRLPQLDFRKIIGNKQPSGTKIAKYMDGEIKVSKFSVGQVVKLKDYDALKLVNNSLIYHLEEYDLERISDAQVAIYKVHNTRQLRKDGKPVFWYEVGQWGRNIVDVPEDFLEELPELVNIPSDNDEGEKQPEKPAQETEEEMVEKFEEVLHELVSYDKMAGGNPNLYHIRIGNLFKPCFKDDITYSDRIEGLLHITSIARAAYQHYAQVTLSMSEISQEQLYTYRKKNADYGNAFEKSMDEDGLLVAKIRIGDKIRRINSLIKNNGEGQVKDERLEDTYLDLANYCVMTILWIRKQKQNMGKGFIYQGHTSYQNPFCGVWECSDNSWEISFKEKMESDEIRFPKEVVHPGMPNFLKFLYEECNSFEEDGDIVSSMIKIYNHSIFFLLFFYKKYHHEKMIVEKEIEERFKREIYQANVQFYRMIALRGTPIAGIILKSKIKEIYFLLDKEEAESQSEKVENAFLDLATYAIMTIII